MNSNPHWGSSLDEFLREEGVYEEFVAIAEREAVAAQLRQAMEEQSISAAEMAGRMKTSREQVERILNPKDRNITLDALQRAASVLGKRLEYKLV